MTRPSSNRDRAVVIGAGIAGLVTARVLADTFTEVYLIDRDRLPDEPLLRRGTAQARHVHGLLAKGQELLEETFPGLTAELTADGAPVGDMLRHTRLCFGGYRFAQGNADLICLCATRPALEAAIRRRVAHLPQVHVLDLRDAVGLTSDREKHRVTGVRTIGRDDGSVAEVIDADLVVDTTGRGSRLPSWLDELGYPAVAVEEIKVGVGYATRQYRLPADALGSDLVIISAPTPDHPRGGGLSMVEGGRCLVTLMGMLGDYPPTDRIGFERFAADLAIPDLAKLIRDAEPLDDPSPYRHLVSRWRRYDQMLRFPAGMVALGDAVCLLNPIYGQGMTVAALQAATLRQQLAHHDGIDTRRIQRKLAKIASLAWGLATGADLTFPDVVGHRSTASRNLNRYVNRVQAAAAHDPRVGRAFLRVTSLVDPPQALFRPSLMARVTWPRPGTSAT